MSLPHDTTPPVGSSTSAPAEEEALRRLATAAQEATPCAPVRDLLGTKDVERAPHRRGPRRCRRSTRGTQDRSHLACRAAAVECRPADFAILLDDMRVADGSTVEAGRLLQPRIEAEVAFVLSADIDDAEPDIDTVAAAVEGAYASLEIVDSRVAPWDITIVDTVADNPSSRIFVVAGTAVSLTGLDVVNISMEMTEDGQVVSSGNGAARLGSPLIALQWLARSAHRVGDPHPRRRHRPQRRAGADGPGPTLIHLSRTTHRPGRRQRNLRPRTRRSTVITARAMVAIIGSGNIGTDLITKVQQLSSTLEMGVMVGIGPASDGLPRARSLGVETTDRGIEGLVGWQRFHEIGVVFDATSAGAHHANDKILAEHPVRVVDLTPAMIGPFVVPAVNLDDMADVRNVNMVTCGGQATIPVVAARDILVEAGRRKMVGGQEDLLVDVALDLAAGRVGA